MTKQEVIDKIVEVFVNQDVSFSIINGNDCLYGPTANGVGCFVGMFMPTELAKELDEKYPNTSIRTFYDVKGMKAVQDFIDQTGLTIDFWSQLQVIHDLEPDKEELENWLEIKLARF